MLEDPSVPQDWLEVCFVGSLLSRGEAQTPGSTVSLVRASWGHSSFSPTSLLTLTEVTVLSLPSPEFSGIFSTWPPGHMRPHTGVSLYMGALGLVIGGQGGGRNYMVTSLSLGHSPP